MSFNSNQSEESKNFSQKLTTFCDNFQRQDSQTEKISDNDGDILMTIEFDCIENQNKYINLKNNLEDATTFPSTKKNQLEFDQFLLSITVMLNSIMGEEYSITTMLSCPSADIIESIPNFEEMLLYGIFIYKNCDNIKILKEVIDYENNNGKTIIQGLMNTSLKDIFSNYKNNCKIFFWSHYIYILDDFFYTPKDTCLPIEGSKKIEKRNKKEPNGNNC